MCHDFGNWASPVNRDHMKRPLVISDFIVRVPGMFYAKHCTIKPTVYYVKQPYAPTSVKRDDDVDNDNNGDHTLNKDFSYLCAFFISDSGDSGRIDYDEKAVMSLLDRTSSHDDAPDEEKDIMANEYLASFKVRREQRFMITRLHKKPDDLL